MPTDPSQKTTIGGYRPADTGAQAPACVPQQPTSVQVPDAWKAEAMRLRRGIEDFLSGDYPNPRQHRPGNCEHGRPYYEECGACDAAHFERLLRR